MNTIFNKLLSKVHNGEMWIQEFYEEEGWVVDSETKMNVPLLLKQANKLD